MLRVIAGSVGGLRLKTVKGNTTRPTSDKVKGSIFNIIAPRIAGAMVLDVFAGTGSLGIEALSRGAEHAVFFDRSPESCSVIRENLSHTRLADRAEVFTTDFAAGLARMGAEGRKFDLVLLDPPYSKNFIQDTLKILMNNDIIGDDGIIVAEHSVSDILPPVAGRFGSIDSRKFGDTALTIYLAGDKKDGSLS